MTGKFTMVGFFSTKNVFFVNLYKQIPLKTLIGRNRSFVTLMYRMRYGGSLVISNFFRKFSLYVLYSFSDCPLNLVNKLYRLT